MTSLERIIRPAQTKGIRPFNFSIARTSPATNQQAMLSWGSAGSNVFQLQASIQQSVKPDIKGNETRRVYDVVNISNPDDPTQHVQAQVLTQYQAINQIDKSRITLNYARTVPSQDVQIVSTNNVLTSSGS